MPTMGIRWQDLVCTGHMTRLHHNSGTPRQSLPPLSIGLLASPERNGEDPKTPPRCQAKGRQLLVRHGKVNLNLQSVY
jgi:hypothetical protein